MTPTAPPSDAPERLRPDVYPDDETGGEELAYRPVPFRVVGTAPVCFTPPVPLTPPVWPDAA